jgi:hypothetical protein
VIHSSAGQPYWALDIPGLTRSQAEELQSFVKDSGVSDFVTVVDPSAFLTLHLDRDSSAALLRAVDLQRSGAVGQAEEAVVLDGLSETLADWLRLAAD